MGVSKTSSCQCKGDQQPASTALPRAASARGRGWAHAVAGARATEKKAGEELHLDGRRGRLCRSLPLLQALQLQAACLEPAAALVCHADQHILGHTSALLHSRVRQRGWPQAQQKGEA